MEQEIITIGITSLVTFLLTKNHYMKEVNKWRNECANWVDYAERTIAKNERFIAEKEKLTTKSL